MTEKVSIKDDRNHDIVVWAIIEAFAAGFPSKDPPPGFISDDGVYEVQFIVNGVALPFRKVLTRFIEDLDRTVKDEAKKLLHEKVQAWREKLDESMRQLFDRVEAVADELAPLHQEF